MTEHPTAPTETEPIGTDVIDIAPDPVVAAGPDVDGTLRRRLREQPGNRWLPWLIALSVFGATVKRGTGQFAYDAWSYWIAASSFVGGTEPIPEYYFPLRGALTTVVYLPAAAFTAITGPEYAGASVLVENALIIAAVAAFVLPSILQGFASLHTRTRIVVAVLVWFAIGGFAPYPLVDLLPVVLILVAFVALRQEGRLWQLWLVAAGMALGASMNIRPAYLVTTALLLVLSVAWRRLGALYVFLGTAVALIPQVIVNRVMFDTHSFTPIQTRALADLHAGLASFVVRYDTLLAVPEPRQYYCSPSMAHEIDVLPGTTGQLLSTFLSTIPTSVRFSVEKVGGALHWPLATPYGMSDPGVDGLFALAIVAIATVGVVALMWAFVKFRRSWSRSALFTWLAVVILWATAVVTLVGSEPETRFALPMVLAGIIGCSLAVNWGTRGWTRRGALAWGSVSLVLFCVITLAGYSGLAHPAAPGAADLATCQALADAP